MRSGWWLGVVVVGLMARFGWGAVPVEEVGPQLLQSSITAVQSTISAVEAVFHSAKWVLEQSPFGELVAAEDLAAEVEQYQVLLDEAMGLGYDLGSLNTMVQTMFALDTAPGTTAELQARLWEVRRHVSQGYIYAMRTQTLLQTGQRAIRRTLRLYGRIMEVFGNLSGKQQLAEHLTQLVQLETEAKIASTAFQRAQSLERTTEPMILESLERINEGVMRTHPR
jgi:hypothetical protein